VLEFRPTKGDIDLVNDTTTTSEATMTDPHGRTVCKTCGGIDTGCVCPEAVVGYCQTCKTQKPETAFPTLSPLRANGIEGARDWNECRACKAARREARKSPDFLHAEIEAFLTVARNAGFGVTVENLGSVVFVTVKRHPGEVVTALDLFNSQDVMHLSFRRLTGGITYGRRYGYKRDERVRTVREAYSTFRVWSI
jgi:hypothetical protein